MEFHPGSNSITNRRVVNLRWLSKSQSYPRSVRPSGSDSTVVVNSLVFSVCFVFGLGG